MSHISISAEVTNPEGFYYREIHEWKNTHPEFDVWLTKELGKLDKLIESLSKGGTGTMLAILSYTQDGAEQTSSYDNLNYLDVLKIEKAFHHAEAELFKIAEDFGKKKL